MWIRYLSGPCGDSSSHFPPIKGNCGNVCFYIYMNIHKSKNICKYKNIKNTGIN